MGPWPLGWVPGSQVDDYEFFLRIFKIATMEYSLLVTEQGGKWKKANLRKGKQSQTIEAKMPSCWGRVNFELILQPSCGFLVARFFRVNTAHLFFFFF